MARAWLALGNLPEARAAAEAGRKADEPENNPNVLVLLGIICLRQGEREAAAEAFVTAAARSDTVLQFAANFNAFDSKGVALSGLVLCGDVSRLAPAVEAHRSARAVNRDVGVVGRVLWLYDQLAPGDASRHVEAARAAVGGTGV